MALKPGGPPRRGPDRTTRQRMLDVRREAHFKYDFKEALTNAGVPPEQLNSIYASTMSKGSRGNVDEAKAFLRQKCGEKIITQETCERLFLLIDRYSRWR